MVLVHRAASAKRYSEGERDDSDFTCLDRLQQGSEGGHHRGRTDPPVKREPDGVHRTSSRHV